jgi:hypothetical protein
MVVACAALIVALGGTGYAATKLPKNSVGAKQIKRGAVGTSELRNKAVTLGKINPKARSSLKGQRGARGAAGPVTGALPSKVTLTGVYGIAAISAGSVQTPISYGLALPSDPALNYITTTPTAACPGNVNDPKAAPGNLCVYERAAVNTTAVIIDFPADTSSARFGAIVQGNVNVATNQTIVKGTWAVTAP